MLVKKFHQFDLWRFFVFHNGTLKEVSFYIFSTFTEVLVGFYLSWLTQHGNIMGSLYRVSEKDRIKLYDSLRCPVWEMFLSPYQGRFSMLPARNLWVERMRTDGDGQWFYSPTLYWKSRRLAYYNCWQFCFSTINKWIALYLGRCQMARTQDTHAARCFPIWWRTAIKRLRQSNFRLIFPSCYPLHFP